MSELFTPFKLGPVTLRNRTIRSAAREIERHGVHGVVLSAGFVSKTPMLILGGSMPLKTLTHYMNFWKFWWLRAMIRVFGRIMIPSTTYKETYFLETAKKFRAA